MADFGEAIKQMEEAEVWLYESWTPWIIALVGGALFAFRSYMRGAHVVSKAKLNGKVAIVTGANQGMGYETALELAWRGAKVYMGCRDETKGKDAAEKIKKRTKNKNIYCIKLDLASFDSIHEFVNTYKKKESSLHILVNNAGLMLHDKNEKTEEGFEYQFGINYVGHFLLTHLLLDLLKESSPSRIVCVGATAYQLGIIDFEDINFEKKEYQGGTAYGQSKLAIMLFVREMNKRLEGSGVTINTLHPGVVNSMAYRCLPFKTNTFVRLSLALPIWMLMKSPSDGAQTAIHCSIAEELEKVSGKYFVECTELEPTENAKDDEVSKKLWDLTMKWTKLDIADRGDGDTGN